jgi:hypothetical protein
VESAGAIVKGSVWLHFSPGLSPQRLFG